MVLAFLQLWIYNWCECDFIWFVGKSCTFFPRPSTSTSETTSKISSKVGHSLFPFFLNGLDWTRFLEDVSLVDLLGRGKKVSDLCLHVNWLQKFREMRWFIFSFMFEGLGSDFRSQLVYERVVYVFPLPSTSDTSGTTSKISSKSVIHFSIVFTGRGRDFQKRFTCRCAWAGEKRVRIA
jgi:hypothetical protein